MNQPERMSKLTLNDLSALPRFGLKGIATEGWLDERAYKIGEQSNQAYLQHDGCLVARLSASELLFLCDPQDPKLNLDHDYFSPGRDCYPIRRRDSHYWFSITGEQAPSMLAKLCGVNFDLRAFANHRVAQTQVARTSAIVLRNDIQETPGFYLLGDNSCVVYLWECLQDAMRPQRPGSE